MGIVLPRATNNDTVASRLEALMPATLRGRLALTLVLLIFGVMAGLGGYQVVATRDLYVDRLTAQMEQQVQVVAQAIAPQVSQGTVEAVDPLVKRLGADVDTRITVVAADGTVLGDSDADPHSMENHATRPEIREAVRQGVGDSERTSATLDEAFLYVAAPVPGGSGAVARVAQPLAEVD